MGRKSFWKSFLIGRNLTASTALGFFYRKSQSPSWHARPLGYVLIYITDHSGIYSASVVVIAFMKTVVLSHLYRCKSILTCLPVLLPSLHSIHLSKVTLQWTELRLYQGQTWSHQYWASLDFQNSGHLIQSTQTPSWSSKVCPGVPWWQSLRGTCCRQFPFPESNLRRGYFQNFISHRRYLLDKRPRKADLSHENATSKSNHPVCLCPHLIPACTVNWIVSSPKPVPSFSQDRIGTRTSGPILVPLIIS